MRGPEVILLYFQGCPEIEKARENLREAFQRVGLPPSWKEIDMEDTSTPQPLQGFPSPTVLVNGFDVETGKRESPGIMACRTRGAPSVECIIRGLTKYRDVDP